MSKEELQILQHSLGLDEYGQGAGGRNFFGTGENSKDFHICEKLVASGFMTRTWSNLWKEFVYQVTESGRNYVAENSPKPPKLSKSKLRYKRFLEYSDSFDNFREFLKWDCDPEHEWN